MLLKKKEKRQEHFYYTYDYLKKTVHGIIATALRENPYEIVRTKGELDARIMFKKDLRKALKNCVVGDRDAKIFVVDFIKDILVVRLRLTEEDFNCILPFERPLTLSVQDKFEMVLYQYRQEYGVLAFEKLAEEFQLDQPKMDDNGEWFYEISEQDMEECYEENCGMPLRFIDKLNITAQRLYQELKGNGVVDGLLDLKLDGISGGVSGTIPSSSQFETILESGGFLGQSVWVFFKGKSIHLSFLSFRTERELIRICKNIYRYRNPGQLSEVKGYLVNEMADGSRVAVARPPFCENWVFFIRKFDSVEKKEMKQLLTDENHVLPIMLIKWLVKGCQVIAVTGEQGSGKTTLLMSMIQFVKPSYNLRIQEQAFELHLRKVYPRRNIVTFRETAYISGQEGLEFQKKTDGTVNILGEVASLEVCSWLIQMGQAASAFTMFTHHAKTTMDLIFYFRNALLQAGGFSNEAVAASQVVNVLDFDIHMEKADDGHRYVAKITEIIKKDGYFGEQAEKMFELNELLAFENGGYHVKNMLSEGAQRRILGKLSGEDKSSFVEQMKYWRDVCEN